MWDKLENLKSMYDISMHRLVNMAIKFTLDEEKK